MGTKPSEGRDLLGTWLVKNVGVVFLSTLLALLGWTLNANIESVHDDIQANTNRLETMNDLLRTVMLEQSAQTKRIEFLESMVEAHQRKFDTYDENILTFYREHGRALNERSGVGWGGIRDGSAGGRLLLSGSV